MKKTVFAKSIVRLLVPAVILALLPMGFQAHPAEAALPETTSWDSGLRQMGRFVGKYSFSADGYAKYSATSPATISGSLQVEKPHDDATVAAAYFVAVSKSSASLSDPSATTTLDGSAVSFTHNSGATSGPKNWLADVTEIVADDIDARAAGTHSLSTTYRFDNTSGTATGVALTVIFADPSAEAGTTEYQFGHAAFGGESTTLTFDALPSQPSVAPLSLGIGWSIQSTASSGEITTVDISTSSDPTGSRLTQYAGGYDDTDGAYGSGGSYLALLTVGGVGDDYTDSTSYPEDEYYDISSFLSAGDTSITFETENPSNNDTVFQLALTIPGVIATETVSYNANGGSGSMSSQTSSSPTVLESSTFTRDDYIFSGWNTSSDGTGETYADGATYSFGSSATLYAQWTPIYTITYDDNDATSGSVPSATTGAGELAIASNIGSLVRAGAAFGSWNTQADGSGTTINAGARYTPSSNLTLYAQYPEALDVPGSAVDGYTVGFSTIGSVGGVPAIEIKGFTGTVRVVVSTNDSSGELRLPSSVTANLTRVAGYDNSSSINASGSRIGFEASQADANTALAALEYQSSGSSAKTDTITVDVRNSGVPELQIGSYYHYYQYVDELDSGATTMSWDQAFTDSSVQREVAGELVTGWMATVGSEGENAWITQYLNADAWLGASDSAEEKSWRWVTPADELAGDLFFTQSGYSGGGTTATDYFANWGSGEPNDYNFGTPGEDCAQFYSSRSKSVSVTAGGELLTRSAYWNDLPCSGSSLGGYIWEYRSNVSLTTTVDDTFSVSVTTPDAPGRPTDVRAVAGYKSAQVTWSAPSSVGTYAISDYKVEYTTDTSGAWTTFNDGTSSSTSAIVTGLTAGQSYYFRVTAFNAVFGNASDTSDAAIIVQPTPQNSAAVPADEQITVNWQAPGVGSVTSYSVSQSPGSGSCTTATTSCTFTGLTNGTTYSFIVTASMSDSATFSAAPVTATPAAPQASSGGTRREVDRTIPPVVVVPQRVPVPPTTTIPRSNLPELVDGPVLRSGGVPVLPEAPTLLLGGRPTELIRSVPTTTQLDVRAGELSLGVRVQENLGEISQNPDGSTEIAVREGAVASITGTGFRPGATVQVFLPIQGEDSKELTRIPVRTDGTFDGAAPFATRSNETPLPIGKNLLQLVSLDSDGTQVVVEMSVNIAQGAPAPEQVRSEGVTPRMAPGQSVATSAGEPIPVRITPVVAQKLAIVEGDDWTMAVNVSAEDGGVEPSAGGALLKLVRDETAVISGSGFMPGTRADVWLFSDPTLLGTITIDENGEFSGEVNIDASMIPVGEHTLQLQGVGNDGYVKSANLGVMVADVLEVSSTAVEQGLVLVWRSILALLVPLVIVVWIIVRRRKAG